MIFPIQRQNSPLLFHWSLDADKGTEQRSMYIDSYHGEYFKMNRMILKNTNLKK
jgi:hypothetical protein